MKTTVRLPLPRLSSGRFLFFPGCGQQSDANVAQEPASLSVLTDESLFEATGVRIAFTGRDGGVSCAPFDSLNLGTHVNDSLDSVRENRRRLLCAMGSPDAELVVPNQVHGTEVVSIENPASVGIARMKASEGADGLLVTCDDVAALLCFADCMPVIIVAPNGFFTVVHAGWRGVMGHISVKGLSMLCEKASCSPCECNAYLGPFIHGECFEVGEDLAVKFQEEFGPDCVIDSRHIDLGIAVKGDLVKAGMSFDRIADSGICTVCNSGSYFSYRASGGVCGRHGAFAVKRS